jgi:hypothetical protein
MEEQGLVLSNNLLKHAPIQEILAFALELKKSVDKQVEKGDVIDSINRQSCYVSFDLSVTLLDRSIMAWSVLQTKFAALVVCQSIDRFWSSFETLLHCTPINERDLGILRDLKYQYAITSVMTFKAASGSRFYVSTSELLENLAIVESQLPE